MKMDEMCENNSCNLKNSDSTPFVSITMKNEAEEINIKSPKTRHENKKANTKREKSMEKVKSLKTIINERQNENTEDNNDVEGIRENMKTINENETKTVTPIIEKRKSTTEIEENPKKTKILIFLGITDLDEMYSLLNILSGSARVYCKICNITVKYEEDVLNKHLRVCHNKLPSILPLICPSKDCNQAFAFENKEELLEHIWLYHIESNCDALNLENKASLRYNHRYLIFLENIALEIDKKMIYCKTCKIIYDISHFKNSNAEKMEKCLCECPYIDCKRQYKTEAYLSFANHIKLDHLNYKHTCSVCKKKFFSRKALSLHQKESHSPKNECTFCQKVFAEEKVLNLHLKLNHTNETQKVRADSYTNVEPLDKRLSSQSISGYDKNEFTFLETFLIKNKTFVYCKRCHNFMRDIPFIKHFESVHGIIPMPDKPVECPVIDCTQSAKINERMELSRHIQIDHYGSSACMYCEKMYPLHSDMMNHQKKCFMKSHYSISDIECFKRFLFLSGHTSKYRCKFCNGEEVDVDKIMDHFKKLHGRIDYSSDKKLIKCPVENCLAGFCITENNRNKLFKHIKMDHIQQLKNQQASYIEKQNLELEQIQKHVIKKSGSTDDDKIGLTNRDPIGSNIFKKENAELEGPDIENIENDPLIVSDKLDAEELLEELKPSNKTNENPNSDIKDVDHGLELSSHNTSGHHLRKTVKCVNCKKLFRREELKRHFKHCSEKPLVCPVDSCDAKFDKNSLVELEKHVRAFHLKDNITKSLKEPKQSIRKVNNPFTRFNGCTKYNEQFIICFLQKNGSKQNYFCKKCNKFEISGKAFIDHLKINHKIIQIPDEPLECPVRSCMEAFEITEKKLLQEHVRLIHLGCEFGCEFCYEPFRLQSEKEYHETNACPESSKKSTTLIMETKKCLTEKTTQINETHPKKIKLCSPENGQQDGPKNGQQDGPKNGQQDNRKNGQQDGPTKITHINVFHLTEATQRFIEPYKKRNGCYEVNINFLSDFLNSKDLKSSYYCKDCNRFQTTAAVFKLHMSSIHKSKMPEKPLQCPVKLCNEKYKINEKLKLNDHIAKLHLGFNYSCAKCHAFFPTPDRLMQHEIEACPAVLEKHKNHVTEDEPLKCFNCDKFFATKALIQAHMNICQGNCVPRVDKIISSKANIESCLKKILNQKGSQSSYYCKCCNIYGMTVDFYRQHLLTFHDIRKLPSKPLQCPVRSCEHRYRNSEKFKLQKHVEKEHLNFKIKCNFCSDLFASYNDRASHEEKVCPAKNKVKTTEIIVLKNLRYQQSVIFMFKNYLNSQSQSKLFSCKLCGGIPISIHCIYDHFQKVHNNVRSKMPILCPVNDCPASFHYRNHLEIVEHMKWRHRPKGFRNVSNADPKFDGLTVSTSEEPTSSKSSAKNLNSTNETLSSDEYYTSLQNPEDFIEEEYTDYLVVDSFNQSTDENKTIVKEEEELDIIDNLEMSDEETIN